MSSRISNEVLQIFKKLHRTRIRVFNNDVKALAEARSKINNEFKRNSGVTDQAAINELVNLAKDVENELRTSVVQIEKVASDRYQLNMRPEVQRLDNVPYNDCESSGNRTKRPRKN